MTNEQFNSLSKNEKKVAIAKDVLAQIELGEYIPKYNIYYNKIKSGKKKDSCQVCGIGSTFLSAAKLSGTLSEEEMDNDVFEKPRTFKKEDPARKLKNMVKDIFSPMEIALIEYAFEGNFSPYAETVFSTNLSLKNVKQAETFHDLTSNCKHEKKNAKRVLIELMQNIIDNDGEIDLCSTIKKYADEIV